MKLVPKVVTRNVCRKMLTVKKNSPHLFFVTGVAGVVGGAVLACRATLKLEETLDEIKEDLDNNTNIKSVTLVHHDTANVENSVVDVEREHARAVGVVGVKAVVKLGRLYGPSVAVGVVGVACLTGSHIQLTRRNAALTTTLALVTKAYDDYRVRVRDEIGEKKELDIYHGMKDQVVDVDGGKKKVVKIGDPNALSPYARFFDETSRNWQKDPELNRLFIQCQQDYHNQLLRTRGHVFLNEVYDGLGIERSSAGQIVGWVINSDGDGFIDYNMFAPSNNRFINGRERTVLLDFNVDGPVYHLLENLQEPGQ